MVRDLKHRFVDGLILASLHLTDAHADELRRAAAPVIVIGTPAQGHAASTPSAPTRARAPPRPCGTCTRPAGGGSRSSTGPQHTAPGSSRRLGYLDGLRSCGLARDDALIEVAADFMIEPGRARDRAPARRATTPDAIFCANDLLAIGALSALREAGLDVPGDVALVGMDNTPLAEVTWPTLTSVDLGSAERARIAAELLLERIEGPTRRAAQSSASSRASSSAPRRERRRERRPRGRPADPSRAARSRAGAGLSGREAMLLLIPALLPIVILSVAPARARDLPRLHRRAGRPRASTTNFIGLDNFRALLHDDLFVNSFKIGLIWSVVGDGDRVLLRARPRAAAQPGPARPLARPLARARAVGDAGGRSSGSCGSSSSSRRRASSTRSCAAAHLPGETTDWLSSFSWALPAVILVGVWAGMPQTTVALLAGLQSIQDELHEAAAVDGATAWQRFRTITLPQLRPVIIAITTLDFIWNFNSFGLVYVLTEGGPGGQDAAADAVRLQPGVRVRPVRLRRGARQRDGARDRRRCSSSTSGAG